MSKIHIGNLVEIRHWIVPDDDEQDEGKWVVQNRFQNANTQGPIKYAGKNYNFSVLPVPRRDAHPHRRQLGSSISRLD